MAPLVLQREQWLPTSVEATFAFFGDPQNLQALTPPWLHFSILPPLPAAMSQGERITYRLRWRGLPLRWVTEITEWQPPRRFLDMQLQGPYSLWQHTHEFEAVNGGTRMLDTVRYALPLGWLGKAAHRLIVRRDLEAIFDYRAHTVSTLLNQPGGDRNSSAGLG